MVQQSAVIDDLQGKIRQRLEGQRGVLREVLDRAAGIVDVQFVTVGDDLGRIGQLDGIEPAVDAVAVEDPREPTRR